MGYLLSALDSTAQKDKCHAAADVSYLIRQILSHRSPNCKSLLSCADTYVTSDQNTIVNLTLLSCIGVQQSSASAFQGVHQLLISLRS